MIIILGHQLHKIIYIIINIIVISFTLPSFAGQESEPIGYLQALDTSGAKWSLGFGAMVRNSPFKGEKITVLPFPIVDYSSKTFFFRELKAGYHIVKVKNPRQGGFFVDGFISARIRPGSERKKFTSDIGLRTGYQLPLGAISFTLLQDATNTSNGQELSASYTFTFVTKNKKMFFIPQLSISWQSRKMADYLWGIDQKTSQKMIANNEPVILFPYTINKSVINFSAGFTNVYKFNDHWSSLISAKAAMLDGKIKLNPAIERDYDYSFVVGATYTF